MKRFLTLMLCLVVFGLPIVSSAAREVKRPRLIFESGAVTPDFAVGGEDLVLSVSLKNIGASHARYITVTAAAEDENIILTSDLNGEFIKLLAPGGEAESEFLFRSRLHATSGEHILHVFAVYEDENGQLFNAEAAFRVLIEQPVEVRADGITLPETIESGSTFTLPVGVYNPSDAQAYNIRAALGVKGLICSSVFFDRLAPGEQAEKTVSVIVTGPGGNDQNGRIEGVFELTYEDENGVEHKLSQPVKCTVTASQRLSPEDEAASERERIKQNTLSKWWISALAAVAVIAILCSVIITGRLARLVKIK